MGNEQKFVGKRLKPKRGNREKQSSQAVSPAQPFELAIGKMIINFAHLEGILATLISDLAIGIFDDEALRVRTLALISGQPFNQLVARLSAQIWIAATNNAKFLKHFAEWTN